MKNKKYNNQARMILYKEMNRREKKQRGGRIAGSKTQDPDAIAKSRPFAVQTCIKGRERREKKRERKGCMSDLRTFF